MGLLQSPAMFRQTASVRANGAHPDHDNRSDNFVLLIPVAPLAQFHALCIGFPQETVAKPNSGILAQGYTIAPFAVLFVRNGSFQSW